MYFRVAGRFCPGSTPRQKPFAVAADAFEAAGAVGEETAPGPPEKPPKWTGAPELKLKAEAGGVATPNAGTVAFAPTAGAGAVATKVGAVAPKVGAVAPKVGAVAPKVGAVAPKVGAVAPKVGAAAPKVGAVAPKVGAVAGAPKTGAAAA